MEQVNTVIEMNQLIKTNDMLLAYFGSNTCGVCRDLQPKINAMIDRYPNIRAVKIDVQNLSELSASFHIFSAPVVMLFIQGKETVREAGIISLNSLEEKISRYYQLFYLEATQS
ncbi:thioredoxin family protein [Acetobacterium sp. K1/6]|jgi:thioredoxin-like negative regulator of GroEL|uniref:thioredoxin family protein n=1 Tax=Acetobacterium sp. K1/6 TaxID=3055467 RepID=UPI002ACAE52B|nr:thioredoxin family protein [Acetobacterium sp. K1/6]MDZ5724493.1 thioredoxin family protein [Acetobacterium sp. K1/6]